MKKLYKKILIAAFALCNIYSCDYLNVSDELAGNLRSLDEIFDNVSYTRKMVCKHIYFYSRLFRNYRSCWKYHRI